jgi:hypothetical protein
MQMKGMTPAALLDGCEPTAVDEKGPHWSVYLIIGVIVVLVILVTGD